jgi:hypothetical protein
MGNTGGPLSVNNPVSVYRDQINQKQIRNLTLGSGSTWDEIRVGPTLHSVMAGTKPLSTASIE